MPPPILRRVKIAQGVSALNCTIAAKPDLLGTLVIGAWLFFWIIGLLIGSGMLLNAQGFVFYFVATWLIGWCVAGVVMFLHFLWKVAGREKITLSHDSIVIERIIPLCRRRTDCAVNSIANLRIREPAVKRLWSRQKGSGLWSHWSRGTITFNCDGKVVGFGLNLETSEANEIIRLFQTQSTALKPQT